MAHDDEVDPEVHATFKKRRLRQILAGIPAIPAILVLAKLEGVGPEGLYGIPEPALIAIAFAIIFAILAFSFANWRCPACGGYLGKAINPKHCAKCGEQLR